MDKLKHLTAPLASLRLTVTLFTLAIVLIFAGTLAQRDQGNWDAVQQYFRTWGVLIPLRHLVFYDVGGVLPFPGGLTLCVAVLINLIAAYSTRLQLTWKRAGLLTIHAGLILLIVGELVTAGFAEEGMMWLREGETKSYVEDVREVELAITRLLPNGQEKVFVIPESMLRRAEGSVVSDNRLPFDVWVERWMPNAGIAGPAMAAQMSGNNPRNRGIATQGLGTRVVAVEQPRATGVDTNESNQPAAYIRLKTYDGELGTWMVSSSLGGLAMFEPRQEVIVPSGNSGPGMSPIETRYQIELRFKRTYLPYRIHLIDATHEKFVGTETPKNFSSKVRLIDPEAGEDRETLIYMNHPLRHRGDTFFQAQMGQATDGSGAEVSGLQVVTNPGWLLPYVSCLLVALGLTWHFGAMLTKFAGRRAETQLPSLREGQGEGTSSVTTSSSRSRRKASEGPLPEGDKGWWRVALPVAIIAMLVLAAQLRPQRADTAFDFAAFGRLPVTAEGRVKPIDTAARSALMIISGRQELRVDGEKRSATEWLLDVIAKPQAANAYEVFRVDHPDVKALIGVGPGTPGGDEKKRFSFNEIMAHREALSEQAERAQGVKARLRNGYQRHLLDLVSHLTLYGQIQQMQYPYAVPPTGGKDWRPLGEVMHAAHADHEGHDHGPIAHEPMPAEAAMFTDILRAYGSQDAATFNKLTASYAATLGNAMPGQLRKASFEVFFNRAAPFYQGIVLYVTSFVLAFVGVLLSAREDQQWARRLGIAAVTVMSIGLVIHTFGIAARVYMQGYAPVTNLYSSAVFIGWVAVAVGLLLERFYRNRLGTIVASAIGFATLIVAHNLADGDTMQMMQAVLDSNFWLSTHVITVTVGYAATFLAGAIGAAFILVGVYTRFLSKDAVKAMTKMMYGIVAFALFFSFVGTVLGGIWADQSWGRFWGWDPKENGAVLIVLMNAIILHARWGGMIRERGVAVLCVAGNIVTLWSWFGTNMLGVGLHSYGFMDSAVLWMLIAVIAHVAVVSVGLIPLHRWASVERGAWSVGREAWKTELGTLGPSKGAQLWPQSGTSGS